MASTEELMNIVWNSVLRMPPRKADVILVEQMMGMGVDRNQVVAEYLWDHWLGEPDHPTLETITEFVVEVDRRLGTRNSASRS